MAKLLSIISIILAIVLFPPAALAVISNNAVPGDTTYPIKRGLEDGIYAIASLNPVTKIWFSAARSDRRYKEVSTLIAQGKVAKDTLSELVSQTDTAAVQIAQINDPVQKQQLVEQYTQTIEKYNLGLAELTQTPTTPQQIVSQPTEEPKSIQQPTVTSAPTPTVKPQVTPSLAPVPTPSATQSVQPTTGGSNQQDIQDAIEKLGKIKEKLKHEEKSNLTPKMDTSKIEKKGNEGVPTPLGSSLQDPRSQPDTKSNPAGRVKTKNEK